jgi:hypothetical protein
MALDVNNAAPQREFGAVIPDGTFVHLIMKLVPGGKDCPPSGDAVQDQLDRELFWPGSADPNGRGLRAEMTVLDGPYKNGKIFINYMTVIGGDLDASGVSKGWAITKSMISAMINSALALDPKDQSGAAKQSRVMRGFADLDNIEFWAKLGVELGGDRPGGGVYPDKNTIALVIEPDQPAYAALRQGQEVEPQPRGVRGARTTIAGNTAQPAMANAGPAWAKSSTTVGIARAVEAAQVANAANAAAVPATAAAVPAAPVGPKWLQKGA